MAHGQDQAIFGLGRGENSVTDPVNQDANTIVDLVAGTDTHVADTSAAHAASAILVDSTSLTGTAVDVQASLVELDDLLDTTTTTANAAAVAATVTTENAVNLAYRPLYSRLTADSAARNATTTLLASGLTVTVGVGTYNLEALVSVATAAAADVSLKFGGTATVTATVGTSDIYYLAGPMAGSDGSIATRGMLLPTSWTTEVETMFANTGAHTDSPFLFKGTLTTTVGGTIIIEFTQGTSDASDTKIRAGSYLYLQKVA